MQHTGRAKRVTRTNPHAAVRYRARHRGQELELSFPFVIGRALDCQLSIDGGLVSRHHARLRESAHGLIVEDLGSLNGVFVNQRRITEPTLLAHGDIVGIGLDELEIVDFEIAPRREKPTQPAPLPAESAPSGESDVDGPELATKTTQLGVLTERERQVFELIVLGHTQSEIATKLHVSVKTVESHRAHIADKLNCRTRAELVAYALTSGLLRRGA